MKISILKSRLLVSLIVATLLLLSFTSYVFATEKKFTVGMIVPVLANEYWQAQADFAKLAAEDLNIDLIVMGADSKEDKELELVENMISKGVDGLLVTPITAPIGPILLKKAEEAGIPIVFTERWPGVDPLEYKGKMYVGFIGGGHWMAGYNSVKALYESGVRKFVGLAGAMGNSVADLEVEAVNKFLEEHPDMKLLQIQRNAELREDGLRFMENFLSAYPDQIEGVWCFNDETALGAGKALKNVGLSGKIKTVGMDLIEDAMIAIQSGEMLYSSGAHWIEGSFGLLMLYDYLNGVMPSKRVHRLEMLGVDLSNVNEYENKFVKKVPAYNFKKMSRFLNPSFKTEDFVITLDLPYPE